MIVQRILQLHGSDIRRLKRPEKGAVFSFDLSWILETAAVVYSCR